MTFFPNSFSVQKFKKYICQDNLNHSILPIIMNTRTIILLTAYNYNIEEKFNNFVRALD